ncbi:L-fucose/L-arabinose isomerase family protein [Ruania sp. N2-46]|uniref:L-fucose/L-arabinose isomerase family protein n=2 Tax=Occultella gossypii TaxID=2800820 RepID=A0ABS7SHW5_9MICO|nr:L-fucose/L-arabinose isomerase family protein [Occultella gossypii]
MTHVTRPGARAARAPRVALVSGGLGAYWPQFPDLLPLLRAGAARVAERLTGLGADVLDAGFISDAVEGAAVAERVRAASCDLVVIYVPTYLTSSMVAPLAQRAGAPILVLNLQPAPSMDHPQVSTGDWLTSCGGCAVPELANTFERLGVPFRSVSGHLEEERAWRRVGRWVRAAGVATALRGARFGLLGHLYPGMLDVSTDLTMLTSHLGSHVEVLETDDLQARVQQVTESQTRDRVALTRDRFDLDGSVKADDLEWASRVSVGMDALVDDFALNALAYYHRGLDGNASERLGAGLILGASLLTERGVPAVGEYELRTSAAMLILDHLGAGGSFTEIQALNFVDGVVEMGHDGPAHPGIGAARPRLRGLGLYHGKRGWGVSVEVTIKPGPVTLLGLNQTRDGRLRLVTAQGRAVHGPMLQIGNTTTRVDFDCHPGDWVDAWAAGGSAHHWGLGVGHHRGDLRALAELLSMELVEVEVADEDD